LATELVIGGQCPRCGATHIAQVYAFAAPKARIVEAANGRSVPSEAAQCTEPSSPFDFGRMEMHRYGAFSAKWRSGWTVGCFVNHFRDWLYIA
jgi:hypothetical protein